MPIVFPTSPTVGATYTDPATGRTWVWDGFKWAPGSGGGAYLPISGGNLTGLLNAPQVNAPIIVASQAISGPDPPAGDSSSKLATTAWINANARYGDNRIINGGMRIDQRNAGAAGTAGNTYTVDRWYYQSTQTTKLTWMRAGPSGPTLAALGFSYYLSFTSSSAYTSAASDVFAVQQPIEADMVTDFAWGTPGAQPITLSFWAQANVAGTYSGSIRNYPLPSTRSYPFSFSLGTATWTKIVITIPGDTSGTWVMGGSAGALQIVFDLGCGATSRAPMGAWLSGNYYGVAGAASIVATNGAQFLVTGVKLEIGTVATPFNRQSLAKSLADCQRYYQALSVELASGCNSVSTIAARFPFPVSMRATPTIVPNITNQANVTGGTVGPIDSQVYRPNGVTAAAGGYLMGGSFTASAEL